MEYKLNNKDYYKFIIDTSDATITNNSTEFTFKNMLPINIKTESYLKVTAISSTISNDTSLLSIPPFLSNMTARICEISFLNLG